jgi:predicted nucleic acid-binding protein
MWLSSFFEKALVNRVKRGIDILMVRFWRSNATAGRILPVTESIAERWGRLAAAGKRSGVTLAVVDGVLAATALEHGLTLVTRNVKDFAGLGLVLLGPWDSA